MNDRRKGTKAMRELTGYFLRNPSEELSIDDAVAKIGISEGYAAAALSSLAGEGILERISVYRLRQPIAPREPETTQ